MATSKRLTRHELKDPDQILSTADHALRWMVENPRKVKIAIGAVVMVGLLLAAGTLWFQGRSRRSNEAFAELMKTYRRPIGQSAEAADGLEPFATQTAKDEAIARQADAFVAAHGTGGVGRGAEMLRAQTLLRTGKYKDAAEVYRRVAGSSPSDTLGAAAFLAYAGARAAAGESADAVTELKRLASGSNQYLSKEVLVERAALIAETSNQLDEALSLYERLASEAADEATKAQADRRAKELRLRIDASAPATAAGATNSTVAPTADPAAPGQPATP